MSGLNGTGVLRLGDLTPEVRDVEVIRDGSSVWLKGYVSGPRCLMSVRAAVDAVNEAYFDAVTLRDDDGAPILDDEGNRQRRDDPGGLLWTIRIRETVKAVVPGLLTDEADALGYEAAMELLFDLKWFTRRADPEVMGETAPENPSTLPTTDASAPDSASTTTSSGKS